MSPLSPSDTTPRRLLNDVRLFEPTPLNDPLDELLQTHANAETRPRRETPIADDFAGRLHSYEILNQYVVGGQWRALALASEASILETPAQEENTLMKLWVYRILALFSLRHYAGAEREMHRVELATGSAKVYTRAHRAPSVVWPFELRVLRAQCPGLARDDWPLSIERLSALERACQRRIDKGKEVELNQQRVFRLHLMLATCSLHLKDAALATHILTSLARTNNGDARLLSGVARVYLQLGCITEAEQLFMRVEKSVPADDKLAQMNRALYAVATGKWEVARDLFTTCCSGDSPEQRVAAANNAAVCEVYLGNPQSMLNQLQTLMESSPTAAGTSDELVFNYCTGLDLHYDGTRLREAKTKKMIEVGTWAGDGFNTSSFKIQ
ncbi:hypothetical protein IWW50_004402 [Coemansia erecta]|nr:hypothetical protein IWW50_004402 [Coemansia erecta]